MSDDEVNSDIKVVIVISSTLGIGHAANRAAVLATGLTARVYHSYTGLSRSAGSKQFREVYTRAN